MQLLTRKQALTQKLNHYFTGKPCKNDHIAKRLVSDWSCLECRRFMATKYYHSNREKIRAKLNKGTRKIGPWKPTPEQQKRWTRTYRAKIDKGTVLAWSRAYLAARMQRKPEWADESAIMSIYRKAAELTAQSGIQHHVDHIVPLQGKTVSGLHVENNLQILTASENCKKSWLFIP